MGDSWLKRTGQRWKVTAGTLLSIVGLVLLVAFRWAIKNDVDFDMYLVAAFMGIGLGTFLWLAFAIRCPECGARPGWYLMRTAHHRGWLQELQSAEHCPVCGK